MSVDQNKEVVRRMMQAFNTGDEKIVDELVHTSHVDHTPFPGTSGDHKGLKTQIRAVKRAFPDAKFSLDLVIAEGDTVAFRWKMEGTHKGPLVGHEATNRAFVHHGNDFVKVRDGKIVEHHSADEVRELLSQLGLSPQPKV